MPSNDSSDKPFDDEPFDAGVETSEESDPKKFIEQLTGKLGQSLRKYNEQQGQPDFELEKFAINSLLSASHTSEMDQNDQDDIIKKVKTAGNDDNEGDSKDMGNDVDSNSDDTNPDNGDNSGFDENPMDQNDGEDELNETKSQVEIENPLLYPDGWKEMDGIFMNPKKNNMFQPGSNDKLKEGLTVSKKSSIFGKIKQKLNETFNQEETMSEPTVEPQTKPVVKPAPDKVQPNIAPSRKNKPFLPMPEVTPPPKAVNEGRVSKSKYELYHKTLSQTIQEIERFVMSHGYEPIEFDINDIQHVPYGETARIQKPLVKNGKQRGNINAQIYRMDGGTYELNMYVG